MHRSLQWLAIGALSVGAVITIGCGEEILDGTTTGTGGASTTTSTSSTTSNATSSNASTSTGGVPPCVLDASNYDQCVLQ